MRFKYDARERELRKALEDIYSPIAGAAKLALSEAAADIKTEGRADIAGAGFSVKWQKGLRTDVYPKGRTVSLKAAAVIRHNIGYAGIFEEGGIVSGKPYMFLPLSNIPPKLGKEKMTPQLFNSRIGPLQAANLGGKPFLMAPIKLSGRSARLGVVGKITLARLRAGAQAASLPRGAPGRGVIRAVPVFVGVKTVNIADKFQIREIVDKNAARLPELYAKFLNG